MGQRSEAIVHGTMYEYAIIQLNLFFFMDFMALMKKTKVVNQSVRVEIHCIIHETYFISNFGLKTIIR